MNIRKFLSYTLLFLVLVTLIFGSTGQVVPASALPNSPTDQTKVPHYFGPYPNWALSPLTLADATVTITGDGTGAQAVASVGANGAITGVIVTNPGQNYTAATASITSANGAGAILLPAVTLSGIVSSISVGASGAGYTNPVVTITGGGATTDATATAFGGVDAVNLTAAGFGYSFPTVDFDMPDDPNGVQANGHVLCDVANCTPIESRRSNYDLECRCR